MSDKSDSKPAEAPSPIGEISQEPSAFESFLDANQKRLVIVGILAILILIGYVIYDGLRKIGIANDAATVSAAATVTEYEKAIQEVSSSNAKGTALLLKAELLWQEQQKQAAIAAVEEVIASYPEHPAIGSAHAKLGSFQQQLGNLEKAKSAYAASAETKFATSSLSLLALGDIAREAGKGDEARAYYEQIISDYEDSHFQVKSLARERIELIGVTAPTEKKPEPPKPAEDPNPPAVSPAVGIPTPGNPGTGQPATDPPAENTPTLTEDTPPSDPTPTGDTPAPDPAPNENTPAPAEPEIPAGDEPAETPAPEPAEEPTETPAAK